MFSLGFVVVFDSVLWLACAYVVCGLLRWFGCLFYCVLVLCCVYLLCWFGCCSGRYGWFVVCFRWFAVAACGYLFALVGLLDGLAISC